MTLPLNTASNDVSLILHVVRFYLSRRQWDDAHAVLRPLLTARPEDAAEATALAECVARLCRAYLSRRRLDDAASLLVASSALDETAPLLSATAEVAVSRNDIPRAVELLQRAVALDPQNGESALALARVNERAGSARAAIDAYLHAARVDPSHGTILAVAERLTTLTPSVDDTEPARRVRIAIIGSSTLDYVRSYLDVACRLAGLTPAFYLGPYGQYAQDILNPQSDLYAFAPDVVIVAIHGRSFFPDLYDTPFDLDVPARRAAAEQVIERMSSLLEQLTTRTSAHVLLHTFATPQHSPLGTLDLRNELGQSALFGLINTGIAERVRLSFPTVHLVDEDRVYGRVGKRNVTDPRLWFMARIGISEGALAELTAEYLRFIKAITRRTRKCLVLDLDNTLWGGVVGEDGPQGIALGNEAPGNAFVAFQQAVLQLYKRGVILALNSKNNEPDALAVLEHHPDMVLRPHHFAAMRINWQDKVSNLLSIAEELNIAVDSLVFVDDNPAECALVRARLPEVLTVELPSDPALYRGLLLDLTDFDTLALTDEDRKRGELYAQRRERQQWEAAHDGKLDAYLAELDMTVVITPADGFAIPRIAQLIGKTNQFNLTTRRHSEAAVQAFAASPDAAIYSIRVSDRFGDHGLVGTAIVRLHQGSDGAVWDIDTMLLSCRVLGRGVETAILSTIVADARASGARALRGQFIPTAKNAPASDFYRLHGFTLIEQRESVQQWELDLLTGNVETPSWLTVVMPAPAPAGR